MAALITDIPGLLHDARLADLEWKPEVAELRLSFDCLRRNVDLSEMADSSVDLVLAGVERIAAYYSPAAVEVRPSTLRFTSVLGEPDLADWKHPVNEAHLSVNSAHQAWDMATASRIDWLFGSPIDPKVSQPDVISVGLDLHHTYAKDAHETALFVQCVSIQPMSGGVPLDLDTWSEQYEAWWKGWREYWAGKNDSDGDEGTTSAREEVFIPAAQNDLPDDPSYRPPERPAFLVGDTDASAELVTPVKGFHEGLLERHWARMAQAWPTFDLTESDRAAQLSGWYTTHHFGRWVYIRHIDSWWVEGNRACVVARGIEHTAPLDGEPAENTETVITYGLRKIAGRWIIWTWSQGWPQHGSAPTLAERQSWRDEWTLGR